MRTIVKVIGLIRKQVRGFKTPSVTEISLSGEPYLVLVSCILSLRTKDRTTVEASKRLFEQARTPDELLRLSKQKIEKLIYPVGFYRRKASTLHLVSKTIIEDFSGRVPCNMQDLLRLKGVGRKTANLVLGLGCHIAAICVDTHVHRISNRLGWVSADKPEETEIQLTRIIPRRLWIELNTILVAFGQNICQPVSPFCSRCYVNKYCKRIGVVKSR